jgi:hypothetical protein
MPPCTGLCRIVRGFSVGVGAADPDLWGFCGDASAQESAVLEGSRRCAVDWMLGPREAAPIAPRWRRLACQPGMPTGSFVATRAPIGSARLGRPHRTGAERAEGQAGSLRAPGSLVHRGLASRARPVTRPLRTHRPRPMQPRWLVSYPPREAAQAACATWFCGR